MTEPLDDDERRAWRDAYRRLQAEGSPECPSYVRLASLLDGELAPAERETLARHVSECRGCSLACRVLLDGRERAARRSVRQAWLATAALAAVLLAGVLLFSQGRLWRGPAQPLLRASESAAVEPPAGARLAAAPRRLAWQAQAGASGYGVRLLDVDARPVWETRAGAHRARVELPPEVAGALAAGQYYWVVECDGPTAARRLGPFWFTLQPGGGAEQR